MSSQVVTTFTSANGEGYVLTVCGCLFVSEITQNMLTKCSREKQHVGQGSNDQMLVVIDRDHVMSGQGYG